jgi:glutaredoxin-like protein
LHLAGLRFIEELAGLSDKLILVVHDMDEEPELAESCGVDKVPAYVLLAESGRDYGIRFFGIPSECEVGSFVYALSLIAEPVEITSDSTLDNIIDFNRQVHIQVFVTPQCPVCAKAVRTAHLIAYVNDKIRADMINVTEFPALAKKYSVQSTPKVILNDTVEFIGDEPAQTFLKAMNKL